MNKASRSPTERRQIERGSHKRYQAWQTGNDNPVLFFMLAALGCQWEGAVRATILWTGSLKQVGVSRLRDFLF